MEEEAPVIAEEEQREAEFTCKRCRQKLFEQADLDDHEQSAQKISRRKLGQAYPSTVACTSYFIREGACPSLEWLGPMTEVEGKLHCPNKACASRIGSYSWTGSQCSCGTWIVPAVQIPMSKVDKRTSLPSFKPVYVGGGAAASAKAEEEGGGEATGASVASEAEATEST